MKEPCVSPSSRVGRACPLVNCSSIGHYIHLQDSLNWSETFSLLSIFHTSIVTLTTVVTNSASLQIPPAEFCGDFCEQTQYPQVSPNDFLVFPHLCISFIRKYCPSINSIENFTSTAVSLGVPIAEVKLHAKIQRGWGKCLFQFTTVMPRSVTEGRQTGKQRWELMQ